MTGSASLSEAAARSQGTEKQTAALTGEMWLDWLQSNDSTGFPWREKGRLLLELPYAPPDRSADKALLGQLIDAALHWVSEEACHV